MRPSLILINPWIYDFAAYDLWSKPLGLLYLAGYLRRCGFEIHLIDCLDVHHPGMAKNRLAKQPARRLYGTGKFWREKVTPPEPLKGFPRPYSRYGLSEGVFENELRKIPNPAAILVTSLMTYWYPGVVEAVRIARKVHAGKPIVLGGTYARLCRDHALEHSGADHVAVGTDPISDLDILQGYPVSPSEKPHRAIWKAYPAFDLLNRMDYVCLLTSQGCPYRCHYCASHFLMPGFIQREPEDVLEEILYWHESFAVRDFAFYDDALLVALETHLSPLLEKLADFRLGLRFHTPNALHAREVTPDVARLLYRSGFRTIRLGLETSDFSMRTFLDDKLSEGEFERAAQNLLRAGFHSKEIGAYILMGLPGQSVESVVDTIHFVESASIVPFLAEYSPIPHTPLWKKAVQHSEYPISNEPLFQNNSLLPCWDEEKRKELPRLKTLTSEIRRKYR